MTLTSPGTLAARVAATACVAGPFALADGRVLDSYFDEYRLGADPDLLRDVAEAMSALVPPGIEVVAGIELGGIPLAVALSAVTGLPSCFLRRRPKGYGSRRQIEGADVTGRRVVLIDDVVRSGTQTVSMTGLLRGAGATADHALCVLERPLGGRKALEGHGIVLGSLLHETDLPDVQGGTS
ncbi:orotate phosphoribosyltransferase [Streptomyces exfoliatus]|uniref:orotate phosphoribosyltransferase n=1 Tax=Streptomyces exfoliatus TaxID=1905 RepID=UPI0004630958|nr:MULTISPECIES: phosphoribosyltransferase family protein [Streptomyces]MDV5145434.1 phosphoribosyltransferase family protein [Streptomyces sp. SBC-4]